MKRLIIPILGIMLLAPTVLAQEVKLPVDEGGKVANPPASLQLEYKYKVGEYRRYDMVIIGEGSLQLPGQKEKSKLETRTELTVAQHAKAYVPKDEIWRMEWDMIRGDLNLPDFGQITLTIPSLQFEMDKYGTISKVTGLDDLAVTPGLPQQDSLAKSLSQLSSFGLPKKPLKIGDTWDQEYRIELTDQEPVVVKATSKLVGYEVMDSTNCAKIVTTYEAPFKITAKKKDDESKKPSEAGDTVKKDSTVKKDDTAQKDDPAKKEEVISLSGTEKGEFCMHFAYDEGRIMRISGTVETVADLDGKKQAPVQVTIPSTSDPETAAKLKEEGERLKHDVSIKYTMTSVYNPKLPETAEEKK